MVHRGGGTVRGENTPLGHGRLGSLGTPGAWAFGALGNPGGWAFGAFGNPGVLGVWGLWELAPPPPRPPTDPAKVHRRSVRFVTVHRVFVQTSGYLKAACHHPEPSSVSVYPFVGIANFGSPDLFAAFLLQWFEGLSAFLVAPVELLVFKIVGKPRSCILMIYGL